MNGTACFFRPEDVLSDESNSINLNEVNIRKGTVAAFLKNITILESPELPEENKNDAIAIMKELAPALIAAGLYKHATFHNPIVQKILDDEIVRQSMQETK
jgi:hypothetical protein